VNSVRAWLQRKPFALKQKNVQLQSRSHSVAVALAYQVVSGVSVGQEQRQHRLLQEAPEEFLVQPRRVHHQSPALDQLAPRETSAQAVERDPDHLQVED